MKITLVRPLPDLNRWSMDLYSEQLFKALRAQTGPGDNLSVFPDPVDIACWQSDIRKPSGKWKRWIQQYFLMGSAVKKIKTDLIHITDHGYANLIPFLKGKRTVVTFHDALLPNLANKKLPVDWKPRTSVLAQSYALNQLKKSNHVIAVSEFSRQELLRYSPVLSEKTSTVHEAASDIFSEQASAEQKRSFLERWGLLNSWIILLPGRSYPHKNIEGALHSFVILLKRFSDKNPVLLKIGSPLTPEQTALAESLGIQSRVRILQNVPSHELPLIYQVSRAVIFLSFYEGFGLPVLEAMASRVPILISNRGSLPEISGGNALIVNPEDLEGCAEALCRIASDVKLRGELIDKGIAWAKRFTWQETAKKTMGIYRKLYDSKMD